MPRELSWLSFNARVLQEAADESVPVIQRLRYRVFSLAISMNSSRARRRSQTADYGLCRR